MKIKVKVQIDKDNNRAYVTVPYKNGLVTWVTIWDRSFETGREDCRWVLSSKPDLYNPARVLASHRSFLTGKRVIAQIVSTAAASQSREAFQLFKELKVTPSLL